MGLNSSASIRYLISIFLLLWISKSHAQVFNIMQFGGRPDKITDNSKALSLAWGRACAHNGHGVVLIPQGTFLVLPLTLQGPCIGSIQLQIDGVLLAPAHRSFATGDHWLAIHRVNNLLVDGHGWLNGQGPSAWPFSHCASGGSCTGLPVTLRFDAINTATIRNIRSLNSKFFHFTVFHSQSITFDRVTVLAPGDSPNTDGIHISMSTGINIINSVISTGDDCVSLGPGSRTINITNVHCGPGHGISIGSLGKYPNEADVTGVTVRDSVFTGTTNGVRIKSWSTPFSSTVSEIAFLHLQMNNVGNPIIIDQSYCPHNSCHRNGMSQSRVQIRGVRYDDIRGTSSKRVAVDFGCSQVAPCQGIVLQNINLAFNGGAPATSSCVNARGSAFGLQLPPSCLR